MLVTPRETFAELFSRKAEITRELELRLANELRERKLVEREKAEAKAEAAAVEYVAAVIATDIQIEAFTERLDRYDAATVEALMENEEARVALGRYIDDMLSRAEVLPDGRRVFETRDGTKVYDEGGREVGRDEITPEDIDNARPKWEDYEEANRRKDELEKERQDLQEHQEKIDKAREAAADPAVTEDKLKALEAELEASAPDRVKEKVEEAKPENGQPAQPAIPVAPGPAPTL